MSNNAGNPLSRPTAIAALMAPHLEAPLGVVIHRNGVILAVNPGFAEMFALRRAEDAVGMCLGDFVAPEARARVAAVVSVPPDGPVMFDCLRLDGIPVMVHGAGRNVELEDGPARLTELTSLTDSLTDEGRTADRLHESAELFRLAFEQAPIGKAMVSPEGRILYVNPAMCELLGHRAEALLGQAYDVVAHPDDCELEIEQGAALLLGDADSYEVLKRYVHADGHVIWGSVAVALVRTRDGTPRYFIAQVQDVTGHREALDALRRETERLQLLQAVAETANTTEEPDDAYATALVAVCEHTGWPLAHAYRCSLTDDRLEPSALWHFHDRDADFGPLVTATAQAMLTTGAGLPGTTVTTRRPTWFPVDDLIAGRSASARHVGIGSAIALPVFADTDIVAVLEFFSRSDEPPDDVLLDLLGHVGMQIGRVAERAHAREQAAALDEARNRFVSNAAHELRTPLMTLRAIAGLLGARRADMSEAEIVECCAMLERQGANLDALVDDLLDLSRLQQSSPDALVPVSVDDWVARALEVARPPAGVTVDVGVDHGLHVLADPARLNRALVNLLANAYRHGGPSVGVHTEVDGDGSVVVVVTDDGDGVPDELVPHLFEPFSRSNGSGGTGLGLAITRALVEQSGGTVAYQASSDRGARFVLRFEACG